MDVEFRVRGTKLVESRNHFVVYGDVESGVVETGMLLRIRLDAQMCMDARIDAIESVDGTPTGSHVALCVRYADLDELAFWKSLNIVDENLSILAEPAA